MKVNLTKTWELLLRGKSTRMPPEPLEIIGRKEKLKLLGVTFEQVPVNWDTHIDYLLSKASSKLCIIRICKYYGYSIENLDLLFQSLILSVFKYAIEVLLYKKIKHIAMMMSCCPAHVAFRMLLENLRNILCSAKKSW